MTLCASNSPGPKSVDLDRMSVFARTGSGGFFGLADMAEAARQHRGIAGKK